jgi:release factor glutamine methyltransferase
VTRRQALALATLMLSANSEIEDPAFESEVLLRQALHITRAQLLTEPEKELTPDKEKLFWQWNERRLKGEPSAYIINCKEFYGLDFFVDSRVLIPRPETELLVEQALSFIKNNNISTIADIGTGSGAIAVSLAVNIQGVKIYAVDVSKEALQVASINSEKHQVNDRITFLQGDLLDPIPEPVGILIANLPYVKISDVEIMPSARFEPTLALDGGEDGLKQIYRICSQFKGKINSGGCILIEMGMGQGPAIKKYLRTLYKNIEIETIPDLAGIDRVIKIKIPEAGL